MSLRIEDYALIGNTCTAALVGRDGSIDWLCMPRFDSAACMAALLGKPEHGRWLVALRDGTHAIRRRYRDGTLVLESEFESQAGAVSVVDFMAIAKRHDQVEIVRMVKGLRGRVAMRMAATFGFDYGRNPSRIIAGDDGLRALAGANAVALRSSIPMRTEAIDSNADAHFASADFTISEGETATFTLTWYPTRDSEPAASDPLQMLAETEQWWREWSSRCACQGEWREPVLRSLITLKALTFWPTGGIVAAPTTSLPERPGGPRNWDYRYCWLRDATFTLYALLISGYVDEARQWREWLLRSLANRPAEIQVLYGLAGERELTEFELPWLPGYEASRPVRIGNAAHQQFQLDIYGEVIDALHLGRRYGLAPDPSVWRMENALMDFLESGWKQPDQGIWEVRGPRRNFTHSKVMAWVAADRAVKAIERYHEDGPLDRWRALRDEIHGDVCRQGFNTQRNAFVQYYGADELDASLLMIPLVGFLPPRDPRVIATVEAIQRELVRDNLVMRYSTHSGVDGLPPGEGAFLPCSFWLADNLVLTGHYREARDLFERLLALRNDVGLLAEEYDPALRRLVGNFPQAFTHVSLVNTAHNLMLAAGPAVQRSAT
ncbi:MAG TPA: glycoside hydrolase family 15 protein [Candidatus Binataceae bacterium]